MVKDGKRAGLQEKRANTWLTAGGGGTMMKKGHNKQCGGFLTFRFGSGAHLSFWSGSTTLNLWRQLSVHAKNKIILKKLPKLIPHAGTHKYREIYCIITEGTYLAGRGGRPRSGRGRRSSAHDRTRPPVVFASPGQMLRGSSGTEHQHLHTQNTKD